MARVYGTKYGCEKFILPQTRGVRLSEPNKVLKVCRTAMVKDIMHYRVAYYEIVIIILSKQLE